MEDFLTPQQAFGVVVLVAVVSALLIDLLTRKGDEKGGDRG